MITSPAWSGRKYAVLGLARSGKATANALLASGADVLVWDDREDARAPFVGRTAVANPLDADLSGYAGVIVSPGVPLNTHPIRPHADRFGVPVIGDIELFAEARANLPPHKVVGITGTNGKSTTTALTHHILKTAGVPTTMGGNIGLPILEQDPLPEGGVYVLELSSYQIDLTTALDCEVAVLLNITPDHLDRYASFDAYAASKLRLFAMQSPGGIAVSAEGHRFGREDAAPTPCPDGYAGALVNEGDEYLDCLDMDRQRHWPGLQGPHNLANAAAAVAVAHALDVDEDSIEQALRSYSSLPHRMERVADIGGVAWINDSKGTNTAASAPALAAFHNVHWIVGGLAKERGLGECEAQLGHVKAAYCIGQSGPDFADLLAGRVTVTLSERLERAVTDAAAAAEPGDTVLLSPACASFDQFRDFEHRGEVFRAAVGKLQGEAA